MKRSTLTPDQQAWLNATFDRNRRMFGGLRMEGGDEPDGGKGGDGADPDAAGGKTAGGDDPEKKPDNPDGDEPLGEAGKKALAKEREERKALKGELDALRTGLADALGIKKEDAKDDVAGMISSLQQQIKDMQTQSTVSALAAQHKITDPEDVALLVSTTDEEARKKLAERLAPTEEGGGGASPRRPKADRTQGGGGAGNDGKTAGSSIAAIREERRAARIKKSTT